MPESCFGSGLALEDRPADEECQARVALQGVWGLHSWTPWGPQVTDPRSECLFQHSLRKGLATRNMRVKDNFSDFPSGDVSVRQSLGNSGLIIFHVFCQDALESQKWIMKPT